MTENASAYLVLKALANKSLSSAQQLPEQMNSTLQWKGVGFSLLGCDFVASLDEVSEMLEVPTLTLLPVVKPWVKGVANIRGRLLPVFDLAAFFGGKLNGHRKSQRLLIFEGQGLYVGLWVDHIYGIKTFDADSLVESVSVSDGVVSDFPLMTDDYTSGTFQDGERSWKTFNLPVLASNSHFLDVAAT